MKKLAVVMIFVASLIWPRMSKGQLYSTGVGRASPTGGVQVNSITTYGASPLATDNSTAITNAINATCIGGGVLYIPPGTFKVATFQTLNCSNVTIVGASTGASTLKYTGPATSDGVLTTGSASPVSNISVENLTLNGDNLARPLLLQNTANVLIDNITVENAQRGDRSYYTTPVVIRIPDPNAPSS